MPENFWLTLQCDLSEGAPDGPGWYIYAAREGAVLIPLRRVTKADSARIGIAFDNVFIYEGGERPPVMPGQLVDSGNNLIKQAIDTELEKAEAIALRIAKLRSLQAVERDQETETT